MFTKVYLLCIATQRFTNCVRRCAVIILIYFFYRKFSKNIAGDILQRPALAAAEVRASAAECALVAAKDELNQVQAVVSAPEEMIRHLRLEIAIAAGRVKAEVEAPSSVVSAFERRRPARKPFPEHLPRERVVIEAPSSCTVVGPDTSFRWARISPRRWRSFPGSGR